MNLIELAETRWIPDVLIRLGIRRLLARRKDTTRADPSRSLAVFAEQLRNSPLAVETDAANQQHYEVPAAFFQRMLGPRMKYSACYFSTRETTLANAESAMLQQTVERAQIDDGMRVLELGCGWGSLTLWMAEHFPACEITAVTNSASQRAYVMDQASSSGLTNVRAITADMCDFYTVQRFDRVVSVEMFEHMRNFELLFRRVSQWLRSDGKAFVHIFCHRETPYLFETEGAANWMGRHFFTGGMMPSKDLFGQFDRDLAVEQQWSINGLHYWRTCEEWLRNLDHHRDSIDAIFQQGMARKEAEISVQRWRIFLMACAELFRYQDGDEWFVAHYRFRKQGKRQPADRLNCRQPADTGTQAATGSQAGTRVMEKTS